MPMNSLSDAFNEQLRDVMNAENQLMKTLPRLAQSATNKELKSALEQHVKETQNQIKRLESAFEETGQRPSSKTCEAMKGLIKEAEELLSKEAEPSVRDAAIIAAAQKVEHYEIASYGTLCTWAEQLGYKSALRLLKETMSEERNADETLSTIAQTVNQGAQAAAT